MPASGDERGAPAAPIAAGLRGALFTVARIQNELEEFLGAPVDRIPATGLKNGAHHAAAS